MRPAEKLEEQIDRKNKTVGHPIDTSLPFFAYGIFRSGDIAWPRIENFAISSTKSELNDWAIRLRNGLPILIAQLGGRVEGDCVFFSDPEAAYGLIGSSEPSGEYKWKTIVTKSEVRCNALVAEKPSRGVSDEPVSSWSSAQDPSFVHGMAAVALTVNDVRDGLLENKFWSDSPEDWDAFFRLQGAYLVLWSIVERLAAFRFGAEFVPSGENEVRTTTAKVYELARVPEFQAAFKNANIKDQVVYSVRENRPKRTRKDGDQSNNHEAGPEIALRTWYQIRSNITHRGKSAKSDNRTVLIATIDLYNVTYLYLKSIISEIDREWSGRCVSLLVQIDDD